MIFHINENVGKVMSIIQVSLLHGCQDGRTPALHAKAASFIIAIAVPTIVGIKHLVPSSDN